MLLEATAAAILVTQFVYHRWFSDKPTVPRNPVVFPLTEEGTPVPLIFGRTIVRQPILAWGRVTWLNPVDANDARAHLLYVVGIGCDDGRGTNRVHQMWIGDAKLNNYYSYTGNVDADQNWLQTGDGNLETPIQLAGFMWIETLNGNTNQVLAADNSNVFSAPTYVGRAMLQIMAVEQIANYRGYISVFLHGDPDGWPISRSGEKAYAFEASSYHDAHPELSTYGRVGQDLNPANAIYLILKDKLGKLGLDESYIDLPSFKAAQYTLRNEGHGYSRCIDAQASGDEIIGEILRQIDGCVDVDSATGKLTLYLVRPDFDPNTIPVINRSNTIELKSFAFGGWPELTNRVRIKFTDRANNYQVGSETSPNQGNAVAQNAEEELELDMPGIHDRELAKRVVAREIAARSKPLLKCRAMCGRWALRLRRGQPVWLRWGNPDVAAIMRVANVERGTLENGAIAVDLMLDTASYVWRGTAPQPPDFGIPDPPTTNAPPGPS